MVMIGDGYYDSYHYDCYTNMIKLCHKMFEHGYHKHETFEHDKTWNCIPNHYKSIQIQPRPR